jgi:hypothetical protein
LPVEKTNGTPRCERVGYSSAVVAIEIHIQHGGVEHLPVNQGNGPIDRGGRGHRLASEVRQHAFNHHKDQHFILDHEDAATRKLADVPNLCSECCIMACVVAALDARSF